MFLAGQLILDGMASGAIYGALALALVLIYRATRVVNFGQGEMATISAYAAWQLVEWGVPTPVALLAAASGSFALGVLVFRLVIRPALSAPPESVAVLTLGLFMLFGAASLWLWGPDQRSFPAVFAGDGWTLAGLSLSANTAGLLATVAAVALALAALLRGTRFGLALRAAAADRQNAVLVGLPVARLLAVGWGLAAVVGFVAAVLVAPHLFLSPTMMVPVLIYALAAATLGGWESPFGAVLAGLLIGVAESLGASFVSLIGADLRLAVPVVVTLAVLMVRPAGLFGGKAVSRA